MKEDQNVGKTGSKCTGFAGFSAEFQFFPQDFLADYNLLRGKDMKLIFFTDAFDHVCRLARVIRTEGGNGLLVGVGGMGKRSLTKLASHINGCRSENL